MTTTTQLDGYLDRPYLENQYASGIAGAQSGMQANFQIVDQQNFLGSQSQVQVTDSATYGMQIDIVVDQSAELGHQALVSVLDTLREYGFQANFVISGVSKNQAMEAKLDTLVHLGHGKYLVEDEGYLEEAYLVERICAFLPMQANIQVQDFQTPTGMQSNVRIADFEVPTGMQSEITIEDFENATGMQADVTRLSLVAMQALLTIYNTTNLRILCDFASRGADSTGGTNEWGNPSGTGQNWESNSTLSGDFEPANLNTDIVEQVWRSNNLTTGVQLSCDTEIVQGAAVDTIAILNHNLTRSASLQIQLSDDPAFGTIIKTIVPTVRDNNIYWILPNDEFPVEGSKYFRFDIDDPTNTEGYLEIGTIVFGQAEIFQGECFVDQIQTQNRDFADTIRTEGFTNTSNSRAQRRVLQLDFRSLDFDERNFDILSRIFENERTVLKCLWIPTPSEVDQAFMARFAVFAKLTQIPVETHNSKGPNNDYIDLTVELDESL